MTPSRSLSTARCASSPSSRAPSLWAPPSSIRVDSSLVRVSLFTWLLLEVRTLRGRSRGRGVRDRRPQPPAPGGRSSPGVEDAEQEEHEPHDALRVPPLRGLPVPGRGARGIVAEDAEQAGVAVGVCGASGGEVRPPGRRRPGG